MYQYFAYGSTLDASHFAAWCQEHGITGLSLAEGQPAILDDWELHLTVPSKYWAGAVGTIDPRPGSLVYGVLFEISEIRADKIRHKEGVLTGLYREVDVEVRLWSPNVDDAGSTIQLREAKAFRAAEGKTAAEPPPPSGRWLETVAKGARAHGLPDAWARGLEARIVR